MAEKTPVGNMPRMVPDTDDIRSRLSQSSPERKVADTKSPPKSGGTSWVTGLLFIVAGAAISYLALQQYSMSQLLNSYEERLSLADVRIVRLEQSLTATDESVAMNGTAINAQFKAIKNETDLHMAEIRKLWDVTNKRNKVWIEENQKKLAAQESKLGALIASAAKLETGVASLETQQSSDETMLTQLSDSIAAEKVALEMLQADVGTATRGVENLINADFDSQIVNLTISQENLLAEQAKLGQIIDSNSSALTEVEQILKAVDSSRVDTNKRLTALNNQLDNLDARVTSLTGTQ